MEMRAHIWYLLVACPWCILNVDHSDFLGAQRGYRQTIRGRHLHGWPHLAKAAWQAISDIVEQAQRNGMGPHFHVALEQPSYAPRT